jgi:hypothetical protein
METRTHHTMEKRTGMSSSRCRGSRGSATSAPSLVDEATVTAPGAGGGEILTDLTGEDSTDNDPTGFQALKTHILSGECAHAAMQSGDTLERAVRSITVSLE